MGIEINPVFKQQLKNRAKLITMGPLAGFLLESELYALQKSRGYYEYEVIDGNGVCRCKGTKEVCRDWIRRHDPNMS